MIADSNNTDDLYISIPANMKLQSVPVIYPDRIYGVRVIFWLQLFKPQAFELSKFLGRRAVFDLIYPQTIRRELLLKANLGFFPECSSRRYKVIHSTELPMNDTNI